MSFWTSPSAEEKRIRKNYCKEFNLKQISQKEFDSLRIEKGYRCCPPGYDYSSVLPGDTPCCFFSKNSKDVSFLGHNKEWPDRSIFEGGSILGKNSNTGKHSTLFGCRLLSGTCVDHNSVIESCVSEDAIKICSGVKGLGNNKFGNHCVASDDVQLSGDNNVIGQYFVTGQGFKLTGLDNTIGQHADVGEFGLVCNSYIDSGFKMNEFGEINSCNISSSTPDQSEKSFEISNCKIKGSAIKSTLLGPNGVLKKCSLENNVFTSEGIIYDNCFVRSVDAISKNSSLINTNVLPPKGHKVIVHAGTKISGGKFTNTCFKGVPKGRINIKNANIQYCQLNHLTVKGERASIDNSYIYDGTHVFGVGKFGTNNRLDGKVKLHDLTLNNQPADIYSNQSYVNMKNICFALSDTSLYFHNTKNSDAKISMRDSDLSAFNKISCNQKSFKSVNCKLIDSHDMEPPVTSGAYEELEEMYGNDYDDNVTAAYNEYQQTVMDDKPKQNGQPINSGSRKSVLPKAQIIQPFDQQAPGITFSFNDEKEITFKNYGNAPSSECADELTNETSMRQSL